MSDAASARAAAAGGAGVAPFTVARIPYRNALPFYTEWERLPGASVDLVPRRLGEEARAGGADAGLMAVVDWFALEADFARVGRFGIACRGAVDSVLLFARRPLAALEGARVRVTAESSTSVALLRVLLARRYALPVSSWERANLPLEATPPDGEAWLRIGDAALAARRAAPDTVALDLGAAWTEWTGLPFVYAVWGIRRALPAETRTAFAAFLERSLSRGERELAALGARAAEECNGQLGDAAYLTRYLERFVYRLGAAEEEGLTEFRTYCQEIGS
jgi:chorismate dehydratase